LFHNVTSFLGYVNVGYGIISPKVIIRSISRITRQTYARIQPSSL